MTLPKRLQEKRDEKADEYVYDCYFSRESEWNERKIDFKLGFDFACQLLLPELNNLVNALKFDCGDRCAHQNPCNAKEALHSWEEFLGEKSEGGDE